MYALIDKKPTVRTVYVDRLVAAGHITREEADADRAEKRRATLEVALEEARKGDFHQMPDSWNSRDDIPPPAAEAKTCAASCSAAVGRAPRRRAPHASAPAFS